MVEQIVTYQIQQALVEALEHRFDGDAYIGAVQTPKFIVDFFANDRDVVEQEDLREYIEEFTATHGDDTYTLTIEVEPETNYKYQLVLQAVKQDE